MFRTIDESERFIIIFPKLRHVLTSILKKGRMIDRHKLKVINERQDFWGLKNENRRKILLGVRFIKFCRKYFERIHQDYIKFFSSF